MTETETHAKRRWSDGPRGRALHVADIATRVAALIALTLAIIGLANSAASRRESAKDSCRLLYGLVFSATTGAPAQRAAANAFVARTPLHNCDAYARAIVR